MIGALLVGLVVSSLADAPLDLRTREARFAGTLLAQSAPPSVAADGFEPMPHLGDDRARLVAERSRLERTRATLEVPIAFLSTAGVSAIIAVLWCVFIIPPAVPLFTPVAWVIGGIFIAYAVIGALVGVSKLHSRLADRAATDAQIEGIDVKLKAFPTTAQADAPLTTISLASF